MGIPINLGEILEEQMLPIEVPLACRFQKGLQRPLVYHGMIRFMNSPGSGLRATRRADAVPDGGGTSRRGGRVRYGGPPPDGLEAGDDPAGLRRVLRSSI